MTQLIALVATAVMVNGDRVVIQPGEPLPDLGVHDARELLASGAAQDQAAVEQQAKADARTAAQAQDDFAQARERALQEAQSTAATAEQPKPTKKSTKE